MFKHYADIKRPWMQAQMIIPSKTFTTIEGQNKIFHDKTTFNQYPATTPVLHKILEGKLQPKEVDNIERTTEN